MNKPPEHKAILYVPLSVHVIHEPALPNNKMYYLDDKGTIVIKFPEEEIERTACRDFTD